MLKNKYKLLYSVSFTQQPIMEKKLKIHTYMYTHTHTHTHIYS